MQPSEQGWAPPRAPLPPHRLAKLANALGVSTPLPHSPSPPNGAATPQVQSKYLLHVIPPLHLADIPDALELAPNASGYHTQFRRGTLVTLQPTLHAQLLVIAREYALPSTIGVLLYLVTPSPQSRQSSPMPFASPTCGTGGSEPGPRLSEEIWKHVWARVLRAERDEVIALSRAGTPNPFGLGLTVEPSQPLRPLVTPTRAEQPRPLAYPITPSTSTGSCASDTRSHEKSAGTSLLSEPNTPDTSRSSDNGPPGIELPGLNSNSIIPILAKVEFDIDRRKAAWYEPWVRSRRIRRTESRSSHRSDSQSRTLDSTSSPDERRAPYDLKLVQRMQKPPFLRSRHDFDEGEQPDNAEYVPLSESPDPDVAARITSRDPLGDVFGSDADTWVEIHAESDGLRRKVNNPNVVELALDASSFTAFPEQNREESGETNDVDEVQNIIRRKSRPSLGISIPGSPESRRKSSPSTAVGARPTPLVLVPKSPTNNVIDENPDSADFRDKEGLFLELEQEYQQSRSPGEDKRVGTVFEDLDLGLDLGDDDEEYDENDPNDRRRSQYLMKAKLDEIEKALAQFSPRQLKTAKLEEDPMITHRRNLSSASQLRTPVETSAPSPLRNVWPSIPYASVTNAANGSPLKAADLPPSTPILALNGISTGAPKAFVPIASPSSAVPTETQVRRRELEQAMYPVTPTRQTNLASDSPIPLSPDPFGRHPSFYEADIPPVQSYWDPVAQRVSYEPPGSISSMSSIDEGSGPPTSATLGSRFSADSSGVVEQAKTATPLVSVKGLKKLWRRSKSSSNALPQPLTPARSSFQLPGSPQPLTPTDQLTAPPLPTLRGMNGKPHVGQLQFDQISRPSLSGSRPNLPAPQPNGPPQEKPTVRKSILKSWKSVTGAASQQPMNGSEPRKSSERPISNETIKARRPSILDGGIPPSPQLPEQYLASNHVRTGSNFLEQRKSTGWARTGLGHHSSASHDLLSAIPPAWSPVSVQTPGPPSPSQSQLSTSRDSQAENWTSPETSQFEIMPAKVHPNLTYPYMTLDHE